MCSGRDIRRLGFLSPGDGGHDNASLNVETGYRVPFTIASNKELVCTLKKTLPRSRGVVLVIWGPKAEDDPWKTTWTVGKPGRPGNPMYSIMNDSQKEESSEGPRTSMHIYVGPWHSALKDYN